jgi:hypothetical protein
MCTDVIRTAGVGAQSALTVELECRVRIVLEIVLFAVVLCLLVDIQ